MTDPRVAIDKTSVTGSDGFDLLEEFFKLPTG